MSMDEVFDLIEGFDRAATLLPGHSPRSPLALALPSAKFGSAAPGSVFEEYACHELQILEAMGYCLFV